ncbi:MAG: hypothetical protein WBM48_12310 [Polyangiales bacterium]
MRRVLYLGCLAGLLTAACSGEEGASGPALTPRPEVQTCLPDLSLGMPPRLSDTDCFSDLKTLEPGPDLIPYEVSSALWTDGAFKPRYMLVPSTEQIDVRPDGSWGFPERSVLIKAFGFDMEIDGTVTPRLVETRFMVRWQGQWEYATYRWNEEGTDAELLEDGLTVRYSVVQGGVPVALDYTFPSYDACTTCHGADIDEVLGPKTVQMNRERDYDGVVENQLLAMDGIGLLNVGEVEELDPSRLPSMANPQLGQGSLEAQARAYLDANCAHCHRPGGWAPGDIELDLRYQTALEATGLCDPMKYFEWAGMPRVAPRDPDGSGMLARFVREDSLRMPSLATSVVDASGVALLRGWIAQLSACP